MRGLRRLAAADVGGPCAFAGMSYHCSMKISRGTRGVVVRLGTKETSRWGERWRETGVAGYVFRSKIRSTAGAFALKHGIGGDIEFYATHRTGGHLLDVVTCPSRL